MKSQVVAREVETHAGESAEFTIKANGKAFKVLIDGLYANKVESITREIWSNALDSHADAGCPQRPFEITIPNTFSPTFRVRDYGTGLDHNSVMHLYTTVFESTKEDTNDQVGKLGLGSKSPFAYTDTFSVTSIKDGVKRFYATMIGREGVPTINHLGTEETTEENGLEVSFPVARKDLSSFYEAAVRVSYGFEVKPIIIDGDGFNGFPDQAYSVEGPDWRILTEPLDHGNISWAKMGCVLYPLRPNSIEDLPEDLHCFFNANLIIDFPVGSLEITASREDLSYGRFDPTADSIIARMKKIARDMSENAIRQILAAPTYRDACAIWCRYTDELSKFPAAANTLKGMQYEGRPLDSHWGFQNHQDYNKLRINRMEPVTEATTYRFATADHYFQVHCSDKVVIMLEDMTLKGKDKVKGVGPRVFNHVYNHFRQPDRPRTTYLWVRYGGQAGEAHELISMLEMFVDAEVHNVRELIVPNQGPAKPKRDVVPLRRPSSSYLNEMPELTPEQIANGGYYVRITGMSLTGTPGIYKHANLAKFYNACERLGILEKDKTSVVVPKSRWDEFSGPQWKSLWHHVHDEFEGHVAAKIKDIQEYQFDESLCSSSFLRHMSDIYTISKKRIAGEEELVTLLRKYNRARKRSAKDYDYTMSNGLSGIATVTGHATYLKHINDSAKEKAVTLIKKMQARYPMCAALFDRYYSGAHNKTVREYVTICDNLRKTTQNVT